MCREQDSALLTVPLPWILRCLKEHLKAKEKRSACRTAPATRRSLKHHVHGMLNAFNKEISRLGKESQVDAYAARTLNELNEAVKFLIDSFNGFPKSLFCNVA